MIRIREFLNIVYGNEPCLGIVFGAWFLGIAIGAFVGAKIEHTFKHAFSVFIITLFVMCLVLPADVAIVFQKIEGYKLHIQSPVVYHHLRQLGLRFFPYTSLLGNSSQDVSSPSIIWITPFPFVVCVQRHYPEMFFANRFLHLRQGTVPVLH